MPIDYHRIASADPEAFFDQQLSLGPAGRLVAVEYELECFWRSEPHTETLVAIYRLPAAGENIRFLVQSASSALEANLRAFDGDLDQLAMELGCVSYHSDSALVLQPVVIPKPWGEEIWYTGMEDRGVARAGRGEGALPLPWVLSALPRRLCNGRQRELVLLKILAPLPDEVYGDLYFELHEEKREVYVVTRVDERAWPGGEGAIRFGFAEEKRAQYPDDDRFREAFVGAVKAYERVRRDIDAMMDERREREGIAPSEPLSPLVSKQWLSEIPDSLLQAESEHRRAMDSFSALLPLRVGDVVKVPTHTPHSLQHGVRTVEFQTPVYERLIVSFAQKVLTQGHWNTDKAAALMHIDTPPPEPLLCLRDESGALEERIVDFQDFEVRRVRLRPGAQLAMPGPADYAIYMAVQGELVIAGEVLGPEQAALLPGQWGGAELRNDGGDELIFLVAYPR